MVNEPGHKIIPFYLITGFLGSGKTTLLREILQYYSAERRIAVIQNEFAPSGIDGKELEMSASGFRLVEVNNGSVFCVCLMADFISQLEKLIDEYRPGMIFLEASGLADPVNIIELTGKEGIRGRIVPEHIITVADAVNFDRGMKALPRFRHQIMVADTVMLNKTDIFRGDIQLIRDQIVSLNPYARIIETAYCKIDIKQLTEGWRPGQRAAHTLAGTEPGGRPEINACVLRGHDRMTVEGLRLFIGELQKSSPRIKGFVNLDDGRVMAVQSVFGTFELSGIRGYEGPTELIAFGRGLTPGLLRELMKRYKKV
ncbi:MAG: GTP-binding protein [Marinilabiliales bacterium]|nr:MAG: GTP-binding protein [Marinilabiliales bacterium]